MKLSIAIMAAVLTIAQPQQSTGYIFLGDSRTVGMESSIDLPEDTFTVAKVGEGYDWMMSDAIPEIEFITESNSQYTDWTIITNLGVNDLHNANNYKTTYEELTDDYTLYIVSVNPCKGTYEHLNPMIDEFNAILSSTENAVFIDTNSTLTKEGFTSRDGLHYSKATYQRIYKLITQNIKESP